jgi:hypothetical protein
MSVHEIRLDDGFRDLLANLTARHRAQITEAPELLLLRATWHADGWARAEADKLLAHIHAAMEHAVVGHEGDGQRIHEAAVL